MRFTCLLVLVAATAARAQQPGQLRVAVTFDDVPSVAIPACAPGAARAMNDRLLTAIKRNRMPAAALVVTGANRCGGQDLEAIVGSWLAAGHEVGSHTDLHRDFNRLTVSAYLADVDRAHDRLSTILKAKGARLRYFRHPLLHAGNTQAKKDALSAHLRRKGYQIAVVTVDNQEWVFAEAYARAVARNDSARIKRIIPAYLAHIDSSFAYYEGLSQRVFRRQIPQVLLLHANQLNADYLDEVAGIMRRRGYRFISLAEALQDSAYRRPDYYVGTAGPSWLQRWALDQRIAFKREPREPAWLTTP
jgi:peptidoglycan/xylan/chitin deacetylase (PgdA/CDA1 family)